jgi:hypothetical protein
VKWWRNGNFSFWKRGSRLTFVKLLQLSVRNVLYSGNKRRFRDEERVKNREDLLMRTILDPRFKLMSFSGCTAEMKDLGETHLRSNYKAVWSHVAVTKHDDI